MANKILERVPGELLDRQISEELFERDYQLIGETIRNYREEQRRGAEEAGAEKEPDMEGVGKEDEGAGSRKGTGYGRRGKRR